ncbi:MAG: hypothetical protein ACRC10_00680 [Thermoguttaceae bacterium]
MRPFYLFVLSICVIFSVSAALPVSANDDLSNPDWTKASWMWSNPSGINSGGGEAYFRFKFRPEQPIQEATLLITADNGYELFINNKKIAEELSAAQEQWGSVERFRIEKNLVPRAANCIAIRAESLGGSSGLFVALKIVFENGEVLEKFGGDGWICTEEPKENWFEPDHDDSNWGLSVAIAPLGGGPWGDRLVVSETVTDPETLKIERGGSGGLRKVDSYSAPTENFVWPHGIVFLQGRAPDNSTPLATTNFRIGETRAYWENDVPAPSISGHKMSTLIPASPDGVLTTILDAGTGLIGSPICSYDGETIYFCMVPAGQTFFHLYSIGKDGANLTQLTDGNWHDIDPCLLPDGSLVFSSTRTAARDEYHANPAHSLFRLNMDEGTIRPITYHITADSDPEVMSDGRIAFVRHDNFLERAKVETHIHCVRPDGTSGEILMGPDRGAIGYDLARAAERDAAWLRNYGFGSPAPLPDGRIAALSHAGPVITKKKESGEPGTQEGDEAENGAESVPARTTATPKKTVPYDVVPMPSRVSMIDMSPTPDNRLLVSTLKKAIAVVDPQTGESVKIYQGSEPIHSVAYLGERPTPRFWPDFVDESLAPTAWDTTGYLYCSDIFNSRQTNAEWSRVRGARVYMGKPMTLRSTRHQYGHVGTVGVELGTFPLMPDGSFYVEVPADSPLAFQAVDAEGRAVVNELSWIYTRPGEFRSCIGCHSERAATPGFGVPPTLHQQPIKLGLDGNHPRFRANNGANGGVLNQQLERMRETISVDLYPDLPLEKGALDARRGRSGEVNRLVALLKSGSTGSNNAQTGSNNAQTGSNNAQTGSNNAQTGSNNVQTGSNNAQTGSNNAQTGSNNVQTGSNNAQTDSNNAQTGSNGLTDADRFAAIQRLSILRPQTEEVRQLLCEMVANDPKDEVRMEAALALAGCAKPDSVPTLLTALSDKYEPVACAAHSTLEHMTGHVGTLEERTKDIPLKDRREFWEKWLANKTPEQIELQNIAVLQGPHDWEKMEEAIRTRFAIDALAHYGGEKAKTALRNLLSEQGSSLDLLSKIAIVRSLGFLGDEKCITQLTRILNDACKKRNPPALDSHEFGWTAMPDHLGGAVAESLGRIAESGSPETVEKIESALIKAFDSLGDFWFYSFRLADHDWLMGSVSSALHSRILESLDSIGSKSAGKILANKILRSVPIDSDRGMLLENDAYETVAARVLARAGLADFYIDTALDYLEGKTVEDAEILGAITASPPAVSTGVLEPTSRAAHLIAVLAWDRANEVQKKRIREIFEQFRNKEPSRERSWVCFMLARAIGRLNDDDAIPYLLMSLNDEKREFDFGSAPPPNIFLTEAMTPLHRASTAIALGRIGDPVALETLLKVVNDFENIMDVRDAAAIAIGQIAEQTQSKGGLLDPKFVAELEKTALTYPELYPGKSLTESLHKAKQGVRK